MKCRIVILLCVMVISACASAAHEGQNTDTFNEYQKMVSAKRGYVDGFDELLGRALARGENTPEKIERIVQLTRESYHERGLTDEDFRKDVDKAAKNAIKKMKLEERINQPVYQYQPSYNQNTEVNRLRNELRSIVKSDELMKIKREMQEIRRLESERSYREDMEKYRESMERVREQQRLINHNIQELNHQREMYKLRNEFLLRGNY